MSQFRFIAFLTLTISTTACRAEASLGECRIMNPEAFVAVESLGAAMEILRPQGAPDILVYWGGELGEENTELTVTEIDFRTGRTRAAVIHHGRSDPWPPPGYVAFIGDEPVGREHALVRSGRLRYELLGKTDTKDRPRFSEGQPMMEKRQFFTGARRMMYGTRPLLEQSFVNSEYMSPIERDAAIEPDGDRIVCKCVDGKTFQTRVALFSRKKLEAEQASIGKK